MRRSMTCAAVAAALALAGCGDDSTEPLSAGPSESSVTMLPATTISPDDTAPDTETTTQPSSTPPTTEGSATSPTTAAPTTEPPTTTEDTMTNEPTETTYPEGSSVDRAIADLADRRGVDPSAIEVVSVEEVDWPDGSIGCPEPDMVYTQAIVNGSRIVLRHDGVDYEYHEGGRRDVFYCPANQVDRTAPSPTIDPDV